MAVEGRKGTGIMVVDDSEDTRSLIKVILEKKGYEVITSPGGRECIAVMREQSPDLILLDYVMPEMDGIEVFNLMKSEGIDIPTIILTGEGSEDIAITFFKMGISDYVPKKGDYFSRLPGVIENSLKQHRQDQLRKVLEKEQDEIFSRLGEDKLEKMYDMIRKDPDKVFIPEFSSDKGYHVPEIVDTLEVSPKASLELLDEFAKSGILEKTFLDVNVKCPFCRSSDIKENFICTKCGGKNLTKGTALQHYKCNHMDFEQNFKDHICPKCGKELKQVGVDYRKVGIFYQCRDCQEFMGEPNRNYSSHECQKDFTLEESVWEDVYSYKPNRAKLKELLDSRK